MTVIYGKKILLMINIAAAALLFLSSISNQRASERNSTDGIASGSDLLVIPLKNAGRLFMIEAEIDNEKGNLIFDTGAETNVIDRYSPKTVLETFTIERSTSLSGASSARAEVLVGTMNDFRLGNNQFRNMQTIITSLNTMSEAYGIEMDGMLGYDFFISGTICINFFKKQFDIQINRKEQR